MMKAVVVADAVEVEMANRFWLSSVEGAAMERRAKGEVVPMPTRPVFVKTVVVALLFLSCKISPVDETLTC